MRRLLSDAVTYLAGLARGTARGWNGFVFAPADPTPLGVIRVASGALLTWSLLVLGLDLPAFLGRQGWAGLDAVQSLRARQTPHAWSFWFAVPDGLLWPAWGLCVAVAAAFTVGWWSRTTAVLAWVIAVSTARRMPIAQYGFDDILATWLFYLAVTASSGQAVSVDRFLERWRTNRAEVARRRGDGRWSAPSGVPTPSVGANLGLRLIQCHLVLIYGMSGLAKFIDPGWWDGTAVWGTLASGEFRLFDLTWLASFPLLINAMTHFALFFETTYPALIWVKPIRPLVIASAFALHLGIGLTLGLVEFALAMIAGNLAFASGAWLRSLVAGRDQPVGRVLYDGACPKCRASMALITALDPDRVVEPIDLTAVDVATVHPGLTRDECLRAMHLVRHDGRVFVGYDAVIRVLGWMPATSGLALARFLPGVSPIGRRVYRRIAETRSRDGGCTDDACGITPPRADASSPPPASRANPPGKARAKR